MSLECQDFKLCCDASIIKPQENYTTSLIPQQNEEKKALAHKIDIFLIYGRFL